MFSSVEDLNVTLNTIQQYLYRYVLLTMIVFGSVGNFFNLIIFLQPYLRTNPCSIYLLVYTIVSICWLNFVGITASLNFGFSIDFGTKSAAACRIRTYIIYVTINLLPGLLILAALDRTFAITRRLTVRQYSTIKMAICLICGLIVFWMLFNIPALFYTDIVRLSTGKTVCMPLPSNAFNNFIFVFFAISYGLLPPVILVILGCITLTKLTRSINRVLSIDALSQFRLSAKERQLIIMLFAHIFVTIICQIPTTIYQVYAIVTLHYDKSMERQIIELFYYSTSNLLLGLPPCLSFYIYFATTKAFRNEFKNVAKKIVRFRC